MILWILLAVGGGAGAVARFAVSTRVYSRAGPGFPWGTLVVNTLGSFLLGVVMTGLADKPIGTQLVALLAIGFLGDFTTFSTFAYESVMLARDGQWRRALVHLLGSTAAALSAVMVGMACGAWLR